MTSRFKNSLHTMRLSKLSTVFFVVSCVLMMTVESVFALPVLTFFFFIMQQPLFSVEEQVFLSLSCGAVLAVLYNLPIAVGMGILCTLAFIHHVEWLKARTQLRDIFLVMTSCAVVFVAHSQVIQLWEVIRFAIYFVVIVSAMRVWSRKRLIKIQS